MQTVLQSEQALVDAIGERLGLFPAMQVRSEPGKMQDQGAIDPERPRRMVAIVGAPASGKTTLAERLAIRLGGTAGASVVVPMDGFHLDNVLLDAAGHRAVKGAPQTFDVDGLDSLLARIRQDKGAVYVPVFDRGRDLARAAAARVDPVHRVILVEGNYLMLQRPGWQALERHFDLTVSIDVPATILRERLIERWLAYGHDRPAAITRAEANDLPNGRVVIEESAPAELVLTVRQSAIVEIE